MKIINSYIVEYNNKLVLLYEVETTSPDPQKFFVKYTDYGKDGWIERTEEMDPDTANELITPVVVET